MTICRGCGRDEGLRLGYCFDCATYAERIAAHRTVWRHITGIVHTLRMQLTFARIDFKWAWERFTHTGGYAPGGEFEREFGIKL